MGIGRFEATLLIAAVQHGEQREVRTATCNLSPTRSFSPTPLIAAAAIVLQSAIAGTVWWMLHA
jgi:hypothetical protein